MIKFMFQKCPWGYRMGYRDTSERPGQHCSPGKRW